MSELVALHNQTFKLLFDVQDFDKMFSANGFSESPSVELINGEILARGEIVQNEFIESKRIASFLKVLLEQEAQVKLQPLLYVNKFLLLKPSIAVIKKSVNH